MKKRRREKNLAIKIYYDSDAGELTKIRLTSRFRKESDLMISDVLEDAIEDLKGMKEASIHDFYEYLESIAAKANIN